MRLAYSIYFSRFAIIYIKISYHYRWELAILKKLPKLTTSPTSQPKPQKISTPLITQATRLNFFVPTLTPYKICVSAVNAKTKHSFARNYLAALASRLTHHVSP